MGLERIAAHQLLDPPRRPRLEIETLIFMVWRAMGKEDRGFASMDRTKQREIASKGGRAAHQKGTAHEWSTEEAREAGRKGGLAAHRRRQPPQEPVPENQNTERTDSTPKPSGPVK
jgi:general stress protein YciG